jgi:hypothetical protein
MEDSLFTGSCLSKALQSFFCETYESLLGYLCLIIPYLFNTLSTFGIPYLFDESRKIIKKWVFLIICLTSSIALVAVPSTRNERVCR